MEHRLRTLEAVVLAGLSAALAACAAAPADRPGRRAVPVYEEVEVPVCERRPRERVAIRFVPKYEEAKEGKTGRCFVGYAPEEIPIGCEWTRVQTGTKTIRRLQGWRWADDPPWPCEAEAAARKAAEEDGREEAPEAPPPLDVEDLPSLDDLPG
jgi:hypothetical protein